MSILKAGVGESADQPMILQYLHQNFSDTFLPSGSSHFWLPASLTRLGNCQTTRAGGQEEKTSGLCQITKVFVSKFSLVTLQRITDLIFSMGLEMSFFVSPLVSLKASPFSFSALIQQLLPLECFSIKLDGSPVYHILFLKFTSVLLFEQERLISPSVNLAVTKFPKEG